MESTEEGTCYGCGSEVEEGMLYCGEICYGEEEE